MVLTPASSFCILKPPRYYHPVPYFLIIEMLPADGLFQIPIAQT